MSQIVGHISQVIGPVVDVYFEGTEAELMLPSIHDALEIRKSHGKRLIVEVQQHIGDTDPPDGKEDQVPHPAAFPGPGDQVQTQ